MKYADQIVVCIDAIYELYLVNVKTYCDTC